MFSDHSVVRLVVNYRKKAIKNSNIWRLNNTEIQTIIRDYYQELYANKMDNLEKMDKFLEK